MLAIISAAAGTAVGVGLLYLLGQHDGNVLFTVAAFAFFNFLAGYACGRRD